MRELMGIVFLVAVVVSAGSGEVRAGGKPIVAVFDVDGKDAGMSPKLCASLSDYLAAKLTEAGSYQVVPRADLKSRLTNQKQGSYKTCYDQGCQIELGRELAAEKTLSVQVLKLGSRCTVTLTLYDLKKAATEAAATGHGRCGQDEIVQTIDEAAAKLLVGKIAAVPATEPAKPRTEAALPAVEPAKQKKVEPAPAGLTWVHSAPARIELTKTEVTVSQYRACVEAGKCTAPGSLSDNMFCNWGRTDREAHPVNCVTWNQATAYCAWAGGRLPTEQEWYAEASNGGSRKVPWGDGEVTCDYAIWGDRAGTDGCGLASTAPVCSKERGNSVSGLCDLSGNVWEWTSSTEGAARVLRGGSWVNDDPGPLLAAGRFWNTPAIWFNYYGIRCGR